MGINERAGGRIAAGLFFLLLPWLTAGCSLLATPPLPGQASGPDRVLLADVPFYSQDAHQCGPAALAMALAWSGELVVPGDLIGQVYTPSKKGSLQSDLVAAARRHGRLAYPVAGAEALFAEVAAGHPVLVFLNLGLSWYPKYHYAVVIGYDRSLARMYLHSGTREKEALSYGVFANTWARTGHWGLLVLPPGRLPAIVDEQPYVDAVIGLEKSGQWAAAAAAYDAGLRRWPQSLACGLGGGNSRYRLGDLGGAEAAFREVCRLHPEAGVAWNNLAQVLWERGAGDEALAAVRRAVTLGGPLRQDFEATLAIIEEGLAGKLRQPRLR